MKQSKQQSQLKKPNMLEFNKDLALAVADFYEYTMAEANMLEDILGKDTVFDLVVRNMPANKVVGTFEIDGVKYDKREYRDYLVNAGLEQVAAYFLESKGTKELKHYMENTQGVNNPEFLDWVKNISFSGDVYAMPEGTIFFAQEHQIRVHEKFEEAQVFESLLLSTTNPQTNVATTANDIAQVFPKSIDKILLEGGSRRGGSPQGALCNSRAARIGGFTASSNVAFGMIYSEKVGGTHGHSYVMLHPDEYSAFKAQADILEDKVCFLLDTYNVEEALDLSLKIVKEDGLGHFAFRIDSGDLLEQAKWIHKTLAERGFERDEYTLVASDDLTASKIRDLEDGGADIDKYLVGTYVVNPPKPVTGVFKLAAFRDSNSGTDSENESEWTLRGKLTKNLAKGTLPGIKQIYRVEDNCGFYKRDIIAFEGEDISSYIDEGDSVKGLLVPIIKGGKQVYDFPTINEISDYRKQELAKFRDVANYKVIVSNKVRETREQILREHGMA